MKLNIEYKYKDCDYWLLWSSTLPTKFYEAHGILRHDELFVTRGLPDDSTQETIKEWKVDDGQCASWLTYEEVLKLAENFSEEWGDLTVILATMLALKTRGDSVRLVYWFDS